MVQPTEMTTLRFRARPEDDVLEAMGCALPSPTTDILTFLALSLANWRLRYFATEAARSLLTAIAFD